MPKIYYECVECMNEGDGTCYPHNEVRLLPSGDWICESCYENAGQWSYRDKPADWPDDQDDRWHDLPPVPKYAPEPAEKKGPDHGARISFTKSCPAG